MSRSECKEWDSRRLALRFERTRIESLRLVWTRVDLSTRKALEHLTENNFMAIS